MAFFLGTFPNLYKLATLTITLPHLILTLRIFSLVISPLASPHLPTTSSLLPPLLYTLFFDPPLLSFSCLQFHYLLFRTAPTSANTLPRPPLRLLSLPHLSLSAPYFILPVSALKPTRLSVPSHHTSALSHSPFSFITIPSPFPLCCPHPRLIPLSPSHSLTLLSSP